MLRAVNCIMWVVPGSGGAPEVFLLIPIAVAFFLIPIAVASQTAVPTL